MGTQHVAAGRLGGLTKSARHDPVEATKAARKASPGDVEYHLRDVPVDLPEDERLRRAKVLRKLYFARLAMASAKARRRADQ